MKTLNEIRASYLAFFKDRGHAVIPSSSLVPENDPTTLFTGSGMQPLLPYLLGQPHPSGTRLVDSQKCFRSMDIEEVGDNRHTTFFEMLGNWSLGDYFKEDQLKWFFQFLTEGVGLEAKNLYVTVFIGDEKNNLPRDTESVEIWKTLFKTKGIEAKDILIGSEKDGGEKGMQEGRIFYYDASKNWWSRAGKPENMPAGEPGGPDSEVFYDFGTPHGSKFGKECHPNCDCGRFLEIGNSVFMQYIKNTDGIFSELPKRNVDFGGGLERIAMAVNNTPDIFLSAHGPILEVIGKETGKQYSERENQRAFRIIADHMKAAIFLIASGVLPSNTDQGYYVRRLIRRSVQYADVLGMHASHLSEVTEAVGEMYKEAYPDIYEKKESVAKIIREEEDKFRATLSRGQREFEKLSNHNISGKDAFVLFSTYGFPLELTEEMAREKGVTVDRVEFEKEMKAHQDLSRTASAGKFKGGLADHSAKVTAFHTATHLMLAGLRHVLGEHVHQAGSNITAERTRFDFTHPEKVPRELLDQVEKYVNEAIDAGARVTTVVMDKAKAKMSGVEGSFWEKYPDQVTVYQVEGPDGKVYSRELCGGPHVEHTSSIQKFGHLKIVKEEASSAGIRRVKAILE